MGFLLCPQGVCMNVSKKVICSNTLLIFAYLLLSLFIFTYLYLWSQKSPESLENTDFYMYLRCITDVSLT